MTHPYLLQLRHTVRLLSEGDDLLLTGADGRGLRSHRPGAGMRAFLAGLVAGGQAAEQLLECATTAEAQVDASRLYFLLASLDKKGFLNYTLAAEHQPLATLEPISPEFRLVVVPPAKTWRLSRFACLRRAGDSMLVESPLGHARVVMHDARLCALPALLTMPSRLEELAQALPAFTSAQLDAMLTLLVNIGAIFPCDEGGHIAEDGDVALRHWEFHDLLFHYRSRGGRHEYPLRGTYRFKDKLPLAALLKPTMSAERTVLFRPSTDAAGPDFFAVLEARRSRRSPGAAAISLPLLGEFLWRSARVQRQNPADPQHPGSYDSTLRPYPGGGAMHELELYLTVSRCAGLSPGLYHYDPLAHELEYLTDLNGNQQKLVQLAMNSSGLQQAPDVLITLATRFGRLAWKYEGVAYALTQKHVGGLYQQMYLVATALGLAPCALGSGNSEAFALATGLDCFTETSVGEFLLSAG